MSDYLDYLAARSLNLTSGIQPRLTGWFEPPQGMDDGGWMNTMHEMDISDGEPAIRRQQTPGLSSSPADLEAAPPTPDRSASMPLETLTHSHPKAVRSAERQLQSARQADSSLAQVQAYGPEEKESASLSVTGPLVSISMPKVSEASDGAARRDGSLPAQASSDESLTKPSDPTGFTFPAVQAPGLQTTGMFDRVATHNEPALPDTLDQRADALHDALSSESLTQFFPPVESDLPVAPAARQTKREADGSSDTVSSSKASPILGRSPRRGSSVPAESSSENLAQPSHPKESDLPVIQTPRPGTAGQPETGPLHAISSSKAPIAQERDAFSGSAVDTPMISSAQPAEYLGEIQSSVSGSPGQERSDSKSSPAPRWMETRSILEAARAQARVPSAEAKSKQPGVTQASSRSISARLDRIQRAVLPVTSTEKQDPLSLLPERQIETIEGALRSSTPTNSIPIKPTIQPAGPLQPDRSQMSLARPVLHAEAPPEPVIHVNIGRIEVHAAPQTLAKRVPQSTLPALGLDEYLKQLEDKR